MRYARQISQLAELQHGHVTRAQLLALGLSDDAITRAPELLAVHRGVYAVGHRRLEPLALAHAAVLACGERAVLSRGSAAALWGFVRHWPATPEVTTPYDRRRPGIVVHRCSTLIRQDVRRTHGLLVTSPERTLVEIGDRLGERRLRRAIADGRRERLVRLDRLREVCERLRRAPGRALVRLILADLDPQDGPTRSVLEDEFLAFVKRFGLPTPQINRIHDGREIDVRYPAEKVIVELDGWDFHRDRDAFEDDRERDADALEQGFVTVRITRRRLRANPAREAQRLLNILRRRARPAPGPAAPGHQGSAAG